jgi:hypothetical protein
MIPCYLHLRNIAPPLSFEARRWSLWLETGAVFRYWRKTGDIPHCQECGHVAMVLYRWTPPLIFQSLLCFVMGQAFYCDDCAESLGIFPKG